MRQSLMFLLMMLAALPLVAAEKRFDFSEVPEGQMPPGFRSAVTGKGNPGTWKIVLDEVPPLMQALTPQAPSVAKRPVLAQVSEDLTDEHFPLLIYEDGDFGDFTFATRFKTVSGVAERMAGIAFRLQNETNYYVLRASSLGNTLRFYKVVNGDRGTIIGPEVTIPSGEWHELSVECKGNQIRCLLDGKELIPTLSDSTFVSGKIAFWTKSDSVSYFTDAHVTYTPREPPAQAVVREMLTKYKRLVDLKIYAPGTKPGTTRLIASRDFKDGSEEAGTEAESGALKKGAIYYAKGRQSVDVIMPVRDRNGEPMAAARVVMKTFAGQTEQNAIVRATPIVKEFQKRIEAAKDLTQ